MKNLILANKYEVSEIIYEGINSKVCVGKNLYKNENVIIKFEDSKTKNMLEHEAEIYLYLMRQKCKIRIPKFKNYGILQNYNYIILEKMDHSLKDIRQKYKLDFEDIIKIGIQLIDLLSNFHSQKLIHRDIKPENIVFDKNNNVYLIDFGLSTLYKPGLSAKSRETGTTIEFREYLNSKGNNKFVGNLMFSSPSIQDGYNYYPKDDMISLSYLLIYLYYEKLPWSIFKYNSKKEEIIKSIKKYIDFKCFYKDNCNVSSEKYDTNPLFRFHLTMSNLTFDTPIKYDKLKKYFLQFIKNKNINSFTWNYIIEEID